MNFDQLKIFMTVAECRSFTKAAELLYISHSTTSRSVSALEEGLGVKLLVRDNRSVRLTPAGELLFREGGNLIKKTEEIETMVRNAGLGRAGKLTVASIELRHEELRRGFREFCGEYREVLLGVYSLPAGDIRGQVERGAADVGIAPDFALPENMSNYSSMKLADERFCVLLPENSALAGEKSIKLRSLKFENIVLLEDASCLSAELREKLAAVPLRGKRCIVPTVESVLLQVRSGNGAAIVPQRLADERAEDCARAVLDEDSASFGISMFWRSDCTNPSVPLFVEKIAAALGTSEQQS